jgi:hypothetical protein
MWVFTFIPRSFYTRYLSISRLFRYQNRPEHFGEEKNLFYFLAIEKLFLRLSAFSLVNIPTESSLTLM